MQNQQTPAQEMIAYIRRRPGMYIGALGLPGFRYLLARLLEDLMEQQQGKPVIEIAVLPGDGIELRITGLDESRLSEVLHHLKAGKQTMDMLYLVILIAVAQEITIETSVLSLHGEKGHFDIIARSVESREDILIRFTSDITVVKPAVLKYEHLLPLLKQFAYLASGTKIIVTDKTGDEMQRNVFYYPLGVFEQMEALLSEIQYGSVQLQANIEGRVGDFYYQVGIAFAGYVRNVEERIRTFAGYVETFGGGSLREGVLDGIIAAVKKLAQNENVPVSVRRKTLEKELYLIAAAKGTCFDFVGPTKRQIDMPVIRKDVKILVLDHLMGLFNANPEVKKWVLNHFRSYEHN